MGGCAFKTGTCISEDFAPQTRMLKFQDGSCAELHRLLVKAIHEPRCMSWTRPQSRRQLPPDHTRVRRVLPRGPPFLGVQPAGDNGPRRRVSEPSRACVGDGTILRGRIIMPGGCFRGSPNPTWRIVSY